MTEIQEIISLYNDFNFDFFIPSSRGVFFIFWFLFTSLSLLGMLVIGKWINNTFNLTGKEISITKLWENCISTFGFVFSCATVSFFITFVAFFMTERSLKNTERKLSEQQANFEQFEAKLTARQRLVLNAEIYFFINEVVSHDLQKGYSSFKNGDVILDDSRYNKGLHYSTDTLSKMTDKIYFSHHIVEVFVENYQINIDLQQIRNDIENVKNGNIENNVQCVKLCEAK